MENIIEKLKRLRISDYIFGIFILISLSGIFANHLEKNNVLGKNNDGKDKAHIIRLIILTIALLVYIYFLETRITGKESKTSKFLNNLNIFASILFVIGGLIFLYEEYKNVDAPIIP